MSNHRQPQSVLVTGGCGFIGSAFVRFLLGRPDFTGKIVNLDLMTYAANAENVAGAAGSGRYTFAQGDIGDAAFVARTCRDHAVDTIVHFAAESHVDRSISGPGAFI
ncbi:MAG: GDP-mannose 4,6-dehydratase, partial [Polyangiaceae bacterium]